jgi:glycosyltransferase involved in cell wall biosynthesis
MPCYNVQDTLDDAISSLVVQSMADFEAVAVDDGSTDGTLHQLHLWAQQDRRIRVIQLPHQGIITALNTGLEACTSTYIARMDADDRSAPDRLRQQVKMLDENPDLVVVSSLVRGFPEGNLGAEFSAYIDWLNSLLTDEDIKREIFFQSPLAHPSVAYRREWLEKVGGYQDRGWAEDYDLWVRLFLAGANFGKINQVLLEWRDHPRRLTHTNGRYSKSSDLRLITHYLIHGVLSTHNKVYIWGLGNAAQQLGELLTQMGNLKVTYIKAHPMLPGSTKLHEPILTSENFFESLPLSQPVVVLVDENDINIERMLDQKFKSFKMRPGIDWFKIA